MARATSLDQAGQAMRHEGRQEWRRLLRRRYVYTYLPPWEKRAFAWDQLVTMWQVIGRLVRGGVPARVVFVDAAFAPRLARSLATAPADPRAPRAPGRPDGLLQALCSVLQPYFSDVGRKAARSTPDALLADPESWLRRDARAAVVHRNAMGRHEVKVGFMPHQCSHLTEWAEQALPPELRTAAALVPTGLAGPRPLNAPPTAVKKEEREEEEARRCTERRVALAHALSQLAQPTEPGSPGAPADRPLFEARAAVCSARCGGIWWPSVQRPCRWAPARLAAAGVLGPHGYAIRTIPRIHT